MPVASGTSYFNHSRGTTLSWPRLSFLAPYWSHPMDITSIRVLGRHAATGTDPEVLHPEALADFQSARVVLLDDAERGASRGY
jgi:hypothetical protein